MWGVFLGYDLKKHIIPLDDLRPHECNAGCWCHPVDDDEEPILVHSSIDGREAYERGERLLA
jgi:hypothetical protein